MKLTVAQLKLMLKRLPDPNAPGPDRVKIIIPNLDYAYERWPREETLVAAYDTITFRREVFRCENDKWFDWILEVGEVE